MPQREALYLFTPMGFRLVQQMMNCASNLTHRLITVELLRLRLEVSFGQGERQVWVILIA